MRHASIPIFVPHLACPNDCVFCNQRRIAGTQRPPDDLPGFLRAATQKLSDRFTEVDIAFFGGSFTGLSKSEMAEYLRPAAELRQTDGRITGIRLSTRPDYITPDILDFLLSYGVTAVELGAQSMSDEVLSASRRGHTAADTERAAELIKAYGFELVLQFMPGLPHDTPQSIEYTVRRINELRPDGVRIYPCVVIKDTALYDMYLMGEFVPLSVDDAADISARACELFMSSGIRILRVGLHSSDLVKTDSVAAGPFHPAFGELTAQRIYLRRARQLLQQTPAGQRVKLLVGKGQTSKMCGQHRQNLRILSAEFGIQVKVAEDPALKEYQIERTSL